MRTCLCEINPYAPNAEFIPTVLQESVVLVMRSCLEVFICITSVMPYDSSIVFLYFLYTDSLLKFSLKIEPEPLVVEWSRFYWMNGFYRAQSEYHMFILFSTRVGFFLCEQLRFSVSKLYFVCVLETLLETLLRFKVAKLDFLTFVNWSFTFVCLYCISAGSSMSEMGNIMKRLVHKQRIYVVNTFVNTPK